MQGTKNRQITLPPDLIQGTVNVSTLQELLENIISATSRSQENYDSLSSSLGSLSQQVTSHEEQLTSHSRQVLDHSKQLSTQSSTLKAQATDFKTSITQLSARILSQEAVQKVMVGDT